RVRLSHEADVGDELELELHRASHAVLAGLPLARRLVRGRREEGVSLSAASALRHEHLVTVLEHLAEDLARADVPNDRARRNREHDVFPRAARLVVPRSVIATLGGPVVPIGVVEQRGEIRVTAYANVSAAAAVATIGAT